MAPVQLTLARRLESSSFSPAWFSGCQAPCTLLHTVPWPLWGEGWAPRGGDPWLVTPQKDPRCFPPRSCPWHPTAASPLGMVAVACCGCHPGGDRAHPFPVPGWQTGPCASANLRMPQEDGSPSPACLPSAQSRLRSKDRLFPNVRGNC